jgi:hypothetical protein
VWLLDAQRIMCWCGGLCILTFVKKLVQERYISETETVIQTRRATVSCLFLMRVVLANQGYGLFRTVPAYVVHRVVARTVSSILP